MQTLQKRTVTDLNHRGLVRKLESVHRDPSPLTDKTQFTDRTVRNKTYRLLGLLIYKPNGGLLIHKPTHLLLTNTTVSNNSSASART